MARLDRSAAGLEVAGHLSILADGAPLAVEFRDGVVEVVLPDLRSALNLRRKLPRGDRKALTGLIRATLERAGLDLRVRVGDREIGRLAAVGKRGRLGAWLGVDPLDLKVGAILATLFRRGRPAIGGGPEPRK